MPPEVPLERAMSQQIKKQNKKKNTPHLVSDRLLQPHMLISYPTAYV